MYIRKGVISAASLALALGLTGCSQPTKSSVTIEPTATPDPFHVDVQVPFVSQAPDEAGVVMDMSGEGSYVAISSDGRVTVLKDSWDELTDSQAGAGYYTQLREGDSGMDVENLQKRLQELGYYTGEITGTFDAMTKEALVQFESRYSEQRFGIATVKLQEMLFSDQAAAMNETVSDAQMDQYAASGLQELDIGDADESVILLQSRLQELGYLAGDVTGEYDYYTALAVMRFEAAYKRELTGVATESMQEYLFSDTARTMNGKGDKCKDGWFMPMKKGDKGADVLLMQRRLAELGYAEDAPNGKYNAFTADLLKVFQENCGLKPDGKATAETLERLYAPDAPRFSE